MSPMLLDSLKEKFKKESEIWLKEVLFKIYGIYIDGPDRDKFLNEDDFVLKTEKLSLSLFFKNTEIALFCFSVRGTCVMIMEKEMAELNNFLTHKQISSLAAWKIYSYEELPNANL